MVVEVLDTEKSTALGAAADDGQAMTGFHYPAQRRHSTYDDARLTRRSGCAYARRDHRRLARLAAGVAVSLICALAITPTLMIGGQRRL